MLIMNQSKTQVWNMPLEDIRRLEVIPGDENPGGVCGGGLHRQS